MANIYRYLVEGECEEKLVNELKKPKINKILSGKVEVLNVINEEITNLRLINIKKNSIIILVYDIDIEKTEILERNIEKLKKYGFKKIIHIQSINNFEDEIIYATNINKINDMFNTTSISSFKKEFIRHQNILHKLETIHFDYNKLWSRKNTKLPFEKYSNNKDLEYIKIKKGNC